MSTEASLNAANSVIPFAGLSKRSEGSPNLRTIFALEDASNPLTGIYEPPPFTPMACHPINNLPHELLAAVFQSYSDDTIAEFREERLTAWKYATVLAYSWLKIRHVCRLWREVACSSPSLHTHIVLADPECVADQLRRSGDLPLSVYAIHGYYHLSPRTILESCRLVFQQHPTRIRYVLLQWTASLDSALQSPECSGMELPNLQDLHLWLRDTDKDKAYPLPPFYDLIPFSVMQLSRLQSYSCEYGVLRPHLFDTLLHKPLHRTLRHLKLTSIWASLQSSQSGPVAPMPNILDLLDELALLEELELQVTQDMTVEDANVKRKTFLRRLTSLRLCEDSMGAATTFLSYLVYPSAAHTAVESYLVFHHRLDIARAEAEVIASRFAGGGVVDGIPLGDPFFMKLDTQGGADIQLWNASVMSTINPMAPKPPLPVLIWSIRYRYYPEETMLHIFLSCIFEVLPLTNVAGLVIAHNERYTYPCFSLVDIVHALRRLTGVRVLETHRLLLVCVLAKAMQDDTGDHIFPHLQHWSITGIDQYYAVPKHEAREAMRQVHRQLGTALLHRRKTGARLQFLELETGYMFGMESDEEADVVLSPNITDDLDRFRWIPRSWGTVPRTSVELMVITNALASMSSAV